MFAFRRTKEKFIFIQQIPGQAKVEDPASAGLDTPAFLPLTLLWYGSLSRIHEEMDKAKKKIETDERFEIRLSGSGGQGMIFAGTILAEAIGINDGKNVVQTQSYGPEARGGASRSDLVVSSKEIFYPKPIKLDLLLCLTQESCDTYHQALKEDGILIVDSSLVTQLPAGKVYVFPFTQLARDLVGTPVVANVIALGTIASLTKIVSKKGLMEAIQRRAPKGTEEKNSKALEIGFELARKKRGEKTH